MHFSMAAMTLLRTLVKPRKEAFGDVILGATEVQAYRLVNGALVS
jgi:hypothetical protein